MERERREREARELDERTKFKRAAAKDTMAFWNAVLAAGWPRSSIRASERRSDRVPLASRRLPGLPAARRNRLAHDRHSPERRDRIWRG